MGNSKTVLLQGSRAALLASAGCMALTFGTAAYAQTEAAATQAPAEASAAAAQAAPKKADQAARPKSADIGTIFVTGTRIVRDGYQAPTPVNVLSGADIAAQKPANIVTLVKTLPSVESGVSSSNSNGNISNGTAGVNTINLRNLGSQRTLVLINGQRSVATLANGAVDINTIPQDLIERVDVVTGGASAQYGSDAVAGVVNFILNTRFNGVKLSADAGMTTYGDGKDYRVSATIGQSFLDDRLHVLLNGEYYHGDLVHTGSRHWDKSGYNLIFNPLYTTTNGVGNGQPQYFVGAGIGLQDITAGGIINSGPLKGTYFLQPGVTGNLNYGIGNATSRDWMIGGDWQTTMAGTEGTSSLLPDQRRSGLFSRLAYDLSDNVTVYGQFSWNRSRTFAIYQSQDSFVTIKADNGFLLTQYPQVAAAMQANGLASIAIGTATSGCCYNDSDFRHDVYRSVVGADGKFAILGHPWSWHAYYQRGIATAGLQSINSYNVGRMLLGLDAVLSNGQVVCRSTLTNPTDGCVPINFLGTNPPSAAALAYVFGPAQPRRDDKQKQDVASLAFSGELFKLPGGPVSLAFGGEWRKESLKQVASTYGAGWSAANYKTISGSYNVKEGFVELDVPLFRGFDANGAARYTDYSTSGKVGTWKAGFSYSPIPDIKFRGTLSRDIRAPNFSELVAPGAGFYETITLPSNSPDPGPHLIFTTTQGNLNLKPEIANTTTAGVVLQPSFIPGLSLSADYWNIRMSQLIGSLSQEQIIQFCYSGLAPSACSGIIFSGGHLQTVITQPYNFGGLRAKGLDFEGSYHTDLGRLSSALSGSLGIHGQVTHYIHDIVDNLVFPHDYAGESGIEIGLYGLTALPKWRYRISATYDKDPFTLYLAARGFNSTVYGNNIIQCTSNCPTATPQNPTINNNHIPGALYFDGSVTVKLHPLAHETDLSFIVTNIFNKDPAKTGNIGTLYYFGGYPQTNVDLFDVLGRTFRVSATVKF